MNRWGSAVAVTSVVAIVHCGGNVAQSGGSGDGGGGSEGGVSEAGPETGAGEAGAEGGVAASPVVISAASPRPRTGSWSVNYWTWSPTYGDALPGTESMVGALKPTFLRVGGYNNDANTPDPFDSSQVDAMVTYARAIGAEPILQIPVLADTSGASPTADEAAAMVTYANGTQSYKIKYFSIGNEPDLYASQGNPADSTQPAIPGYTPAQYCATARAFVTAMKAAALTADPSTPIAIVGPDLAYQYQPPNDWLTPVLEGCGDLFDVVSIHRYPFSSVMATIPAAAADAASFRATITNVRKLMAAAGAGSKPLALTEMNIVYDATTTVLGASPGTVPSALWLADALGSALDLGLWTSSVWDISDPDDWSLGLIGLPPAHTPRPEYYAYALYADFFGPSLVDVTMAPPGIDAHASRNATGTATEVILSNWTAQDQVLSFQVTGLPISPVPPVYTLPALSMAAVEIPDRGVSTASVYGAAQHDAGGGPAPLPQGAIPSPPVADAGIADAADASFTCVSVPPRTAAITTAGADSGTSLQFGTAGSLWGLFSFAGMGQPAPTAALTPDGLGLAITASLDPSLPPSASYSGVGLYYSSSACLDVTGYTGVQFDFAGDVTGCSLTFGANDSSDLSTADDVNRGGCAGNVCYGPSKVIPVTSPATIQVPFSALGGGMPQDGLDATTVVAIQWQLLGPGSAPDGGGCTASFTVENVSFY